MVNERRRETGWAMAVAGMQRSAGLRHSAVSTCHSLNAPLVSLEMKNSFPLNEWHLSTQELLQNCCLSLGVNTFTRSYMCCWVILVLQIGAVGASPCALLLCWLSQLVCPGPHTHGRATPEQAQGKCICKEQGRQHPGSEHKAWILSGKWVLRKQKYYVYAASQWSPQWPNRGNHLFCRQHTCVSTSGTLETFVYSIKLKVFWL